ncbi:MAG: adenylate/guanylate cyclase domain-containing protein [Bacteroidota bacterium]
MTPKFKRNITRVIPFGIIWTIFFSAQIINDLTLNRNQIISGGGDVALTPGVAIFALIASFFSGLIIGVFEVMIFERRFRKFSFFTSIFIKLAIYLIVFVLLILALYPMALAIESNEALYSEGTGDRVMQFLSSLSFLNTMVQLGFALFLSVIYSAVSENIGYNQLRDLIFGVYHKPVNEKRIFMFLDMKDSTNIAEKLGNDRYFGLLSDYYDAMSDSIIRHKGEVYQYIGDEVVVTWKAEEGLENANCLHTFFSIGEALEKKRDRFTKAYDRLPAFKAGIHIGEATTGEMGALKREIVFSGDVLNTAARLQGMCKVYGKDCLISKDLKDALPEIEGFEILLEGTEALRGKESVTEIYSVQNNS